MKKRTLVFFLAISLSSISSLRAETMLVEGGANDIPAAVHAEAFDPRTIVLLTQQLSDETISLLLREETGLNALILKNGSLEDVAVEAAALKEFRFADFRKGGEIRFSPEAGSLFEIYLDTADIADRPAEQTPSFLLWLNHRLLATIPPLRPQGMHKRYKQITEVSLAPGKRYSLRVKTEDAKENNSVLGMTVRLLLVDTKKRNDFQGILSRKIQNPSFALSCLLTSRQGVLFQRPAAAPRPTSALLKIVLFPKKSKLNDEAEILKPSEEVADSRGLSPLLRIGNTTYTLAHFAGWEEFLNNPNEDIYLEKDIPLLTNDQILSYEFLENPFCGIRWAMLDFAAPQQTAASAAQPETFFARINPTKCLIHVTGATQPFWLIFSETFHHHWKIFPPEPRDQWRTDTAAIADYPLLKTKEGRHAALFEPKDIAYLRKAALAFPHIQANGYANAWYIDPKKHGLNENFDLVLFYWPQSVFYLGIRIFLVSLSLGLFMVLWRLLRNLLAKKQNNKKANAK